MFVAYELGAVKLKALSTVGAKRLSTLRYSKGGFDYSQLFENVGFLKAKESDCWLEISDYQDCFYDVIETDINNPRGLRAYETDALDKTFDSLHNLKSCRGNTDFPLHVCRATTQNEIKKIMETFGRIHGYKLK